MRKCLLGLLALLTLALLSPAAPLPAPFTNGPGYKYTVTAHIGSGSSVAHDIYTVTDTMDSEFYVKTLQAFGYTKNTDFADVRSDFHISSVTVVGVMILPQSWTQFPSVADIVNVGQISLAFIE
jgi:hypothetical protein